MDNQKQQLIARLKEANNVLVTVSKNPTVDQLSAALGITLALNKLKKHATAVFSGKPPSVIEFLEPDKTFEKNTDSLRDFIISLDRAKADKLRYKVEDTHVRIYISPYRTSIQSDDLEFSQGEANVDVVVALGVHDQSELDQAIVAHGKILHDATIATVNAAEGGTVGSIDWTDTNASGVSEMVAALSIELAAEKGIDDRIATALLTGIVSETDRFSNEKTKPMTLSLSSKLMEAGANQQLVSEKLQPPPPPPPPPPPEPKQPDNTSTQLPEVPSYSDIDGNQQVENTEDTAQTSQQPEQTDDDGTLHINHEEFEEDEQKQEEKDQIHIDDHGNFYPYGQGMMQDTQMPSTQSATNPALQSLTQQDTVSNNEGLPPIIKKPQSAMLSDSPTTQQEGELGIDEQKNDNTDEEFYDPLSSQSKRNERILQHNDGDNEQKDETPQHGAQEDNQPSPDNTAPVTQTPQPPQQEDHDQQDQSATPLEGPTRTLQDIERSVGAHQNNGNERTNESVDAVSSNQENTPKSAGNPPDVNNARQAILDAMDASGNASQAPSPAQQQPQVQNPQQPPPVPPPMMPPQQ